MKETPYAASMVPNRRQRGYGNSYNLKKKTRVRAEYGRFLIVIKNVFGMWLAGHAG
jgi:hypothetical protein